MNKEPVSGKVFLLAISALMFVPAMVHIASGELHPITAVVPAIGVAIAVMFFFPEKTIMLLTAKYARTKRMHMGTPNSADVYWFLVGARFLRKRRVTDLMFARELAVLMVRSSPAGPADERPSAALRWVKKGHGLVLLRNALVAGMSGFELRSHMSGDALLDVDAVSMLSAFKAHPDDDLTYLTASS